MLHELASTPVYAMYMLYMPRLSGRTYGAYKCHIQCVIRLHSIIRRIGRDRKKKNSVYPNPSDSGELPKASFSVLTGYTGAGRIAGNPTQFK